jgi:translation initiation factor IF-1
MDNKSTQTSGKKEKITIDGTVIKALPDTTFTVRLENGKEIFAYLAGRMKVNYVRVIPGDKVKVEISAYDLTKGRIVYRYK